jgi:gamma-glutamyltranspeptidase/glutathione hydrolase
VIQAETGTFDAATAQALRAMGHAVQRPEEEASDGRRSSDVWGNFQTVAWDIAGNRLEAGTDPRNPVGKGSVSKPDASR